MDKNEFKQMMEAMQAGFARVDSRFDAQDARMDAFEARIGALENGKAQTGKKSSGKPAPTPEKEMVDYTNRKGVTKRVSKAQADHWAKTAQASDERKATYNDRRQAFVSAPVPKALEEAIRKNRAAVTAKEARKMGFVGTREDLKALKAQILGK